MLSKMQKKPFYFEVRKEQSSATEGMHICLPTTCKLLGIPRCLGQAIKAALLHKEEVATQVLATVSKTKYPGSKFYWYFLNNLIVPVQPTSAKATKIVSVLNGHIIQLSEGSLHAIDDIGQHYFPKKLQSVTFGGTNSIYGFLPSGMPEWNDLTKRKNHQVLHKQIEDACNFPEMMKKIVEESTQSP